MITIIGCVITLCRSRQFLPQLSMLSNLGVLSELRVGTVPKVQLVPTVSGPGNTYLQLTQCACSFTPCSRWGSSPNWFRMHWRVTEELCGGPVVNKPSRSGTRGLMYLTKNWTTTGNSAICLQTMKQEFSCICSEIPPHENHGCEKARWPMSDPIVVR